MSLEETLKRKVKRPHKEASAHGLRALGGAAALPQAGIIANGLIHRVSSNKREAT